MNQIFHSDIRKWMLILLCCISAFYANAQLVDDHYKNQRYRETTLNVTGILQTFPLFNRITDFRGQEPTILVKWSMNKRKPRALRIGFGAILDDNVDVESKFYLSVGTERNRLLFNQFYVMSGLDIVITATENGDNGFFGVGWPFGFKYDITKELSIYTEAKLLLGLGLDQGSIVFDTRPPTSIYLSYRFYRQPIKPRGYE